jgi:hypothetical protein
MLTGTILDVLCARPSEDSLRAMSKASAREWARALRWMDISGVALYFLHQVEDEGLTEWVPGAVLARLRTNREQNGERARDFGRELREIGRSFAEAGVPFLVLKGFANIPEACPDPALRLQVDLDLMVEERHTSQVQDILQWHGYGLTAIGRGAWEFRTQSTEIPRLQDLYKAKPERSLDVHPVPPGVFEKAYATCCERELLNTRFRALDPVARVLAQSTHLAKHMRGEWTRLSWLLEMQSALHYWSDNAAFWAELGSRLRQDSSAAEEMGTAVLLCRAVLGGSYGNEVLCEAEQCVPQGVRLWIAEYGREAVLRSFPGSKLYLLIPSAPGRKHSERHRRLLPISAPSPVVPPAMRDEYRVRAAWAQLRFVGFRLRFHVREGARYLFAAPRWRRLVAQLEEGGEAA